MFKKFFKSRLDYLRAIIIFIALILVFRLADLQIVKGDYYKNRAENIRTRTLTIDAPRGPIVDKYGRALAGNQMSYSVDILKADLPKSNVNEIALTVLNIIERNGDTIKDDIPILINPIRFTFTDDEAAWKAKYNIPANATAQEAFKKIRLDNHIPDEMVDIEAYDMLVQQYGIELPFNVDDFQFSFKKDELKWKKSRKFDENASAEEIFNKLASDYEIPRKQNGDPNGYTDDDVKRLISIRSLLSQNVYKAYEPVEIASDISEQTRAQLEESKIFLPGIEIIQKPIREYPNGDFASHILGYMSKIGAELESLADKGYGAQDMIGKSGIEASMEQYLKGKDGWKQIEVDASGAMIDTVDEEEPIPGDTVFLTIDNKVQKVAEDALKQTMETIQKGDASKGVTAYPNATTGAVVAIDVNSGRILALASEPKFDPNLFASGISSKDWKTLQPISSEQYTPRPLINNAISSALPPGSTLKMLTGMAGLETKSISPTEIINDLGPYRGPNNVLGSYGPSCAIWKSSGRTHGAVNIVKAIQVSCNYFFFEVGRRVGGDTFEQYAKNLGFGERTGIELPGEARGTIGGPAYKQAVYEKYLTNYLTYKLKLDDNTKQEVVKLFHSDSSVSDIRKQLKDLGITDYSSKEKIIQYITESRWKLYDMIQAAIGQGYNTMTPIQMADYIATIANGGTRYKPYLVDRVVSYDGVTKLAKSPEIVGKINVSQNTLDWLKQGMYSVVNTPAGTAYREFSGLNVVAAAKTGTAQSGTGYSNHAWTVAYAPYDKPQIAVAVVVTQGGHGNYVAPVARAIIEQYLTAEEARDNITPTNDIVQ